MARRYVTLDVFTNTALAGNPLAIVLESEGLDGARMQAIAAEFNLSETVFLSAPTDPRHRARVRIFTPKTELPFAGHPLVGTASYLALSGELPTQAFGIEAPVGQISCAVERQSDGLAFARLRLPRVAEYLGAGPAPEAAAAALGLDPADIGLDRHTTSRHSAGVPYDFVPVRDLGALKRARPLEPAFGATFTGTHPSSLVYTRARTDAGSDWRVRMFAPGLGVTEDPATGSAAAAFAGVLMQFEQLGEGAHDVVIEQGVEMGRPSRIGLQVNVVSGAMTHLELAGQAVLVSEGTIRL